MELAVARRLRLDPQQITAHCGLHVVELNRQGWIEPESDGYFFRQTRFLSRFAIRSGGHALKPVCCVNVEPHATTSYFLLPSPAGDKAGPAGDPHGGGEIVAKGIEIQVNAFVGGGWRLEVAVTNRALAAAVVPLSLLFEADFADADEVSSGKRRQTAKVRRDFAVSGGAGEVTFAYQHAKLNHSTHVRLASSGADIGDDGEAVSLTLTLAPRQTGRIAIEVAPVFLGEAIEPWFGFDGGPTVSAGAIVLHREWLSKTTDLEATDPCMTAAWRRAATDLWSLQRLDGKGDAVFAPIAGIPKYAGLFGRDSLVAGIQSTFLNPSTLAGSLAAVGQWTAKTVDNRYDAQPGKVLHQRQLGPLALLGLTPFLHYYGDHSAPAWFLIGAANHFLKTGDAAAYEALRDKIDATLAWMDRDGDIDGDGFYEYRTLAGKDGLKNQGWKDSGQAILYPDGAFVPDPIAVVEVQGLFYAAKQAIAAVSALLGERARAERLLNEAAVLKARFNARFWMEEERFFALALDPDKKLVRTIASNPGMCLACGVVDDDKARAVADRLMAPDMFSGWGVRTLSSDHPAYNPFAYHLGSVWPVSNAHACLGFKRYGFDDALHRTAKAMIDATSLFDFDRLPEVFGGAPRDERHPHPGIYPDACSPQAWSASAVVQICHLMTGLFPIAPLRALIVDPALPEWAPEVTVRNLEVGDARLSLSLRREADGETSCRLLEGGEGLRLIRLQPGAGRDRFALAVEAAMKLGP